MANIVRIKIKKVIRLKDYFVCQIGDEALGMSFSINIYKTNGVCPQEGMELIFTQRPEGGPNAVSLWMDHKHIADF